MDKEKTGILIKNARTEKGLTQLELSALLGVTNKAVSRWEHGETFPDVALLDSLADVLDLKIEELVLGEKTEASEAVTYQEIIQTVKLQQKQRARQYRNALGGVFVCALLGLEGYLFLIEKSSQWSWAMFVLSLVVVLLITGVMTRKMESRGNKKNVLSLISLITCSYLFVLMLAAILTVRSGSLPFHLELRDYGPLLFCQLTAVWLFNFFAVVFFIIKLIREESASVFGLYISEATVFLATFYYNVLGSLMNFSVSSLLGMLLGTAMTVFPFLAVALVTAFLRRKTVPKAKP